MVTYTKWDDAPLVLNAADIVVITGLSKPLVYDMMKRADFPAIRISSKRIVVSKEAFQSWLNSQAVSAS